MVDSDVISRSDIIAALTAKLRHANFSILSQSIQSNLMQIHVQNHVNNRQQTVRFGVKIAHQREKFFYTLMEKLRKFNIDLLDGHVVDCYAASDSFLILDETSINQVNDLMDFDQILTVLRCVARLHAASLIFEEKLGFKLLEDEATDFNEIVDAPAEFKEKLAELSQPSQRFRNVLSHGDLSTNGFEVEGGKVKLRDFSHIKYLPPCHDVLDLIFSNTSREFRQERLYELLGLYYTCLEKIVKVAAGLKLEKVGLAFDDFLESCELYKSLVLVQVVHRLKKLIQEGCDVGVRNRMEEFAEDLREEQQKCHQ